MMVSVCWGVRCYAFLLLFGDAPLFSSNFERRSHCRVGPYWLPLPSSDCLKMSASEGSLFGLRARVEIELVTPNKSDPSEERHYVSNREPPWKLRPLSPAAIGSVLFLHLPVTLNISVQRQLFVIARRCGADRTGTYLTGLPAVHFSSTLNCPRSRRVTASAALVRTRRHTGDGCLPGLSALSGPGASGTSTSLWTRSSSTAFFAEGTRTSGPTTTSPTRARVARTCPLDDARRAKACPEDLECPSRRLSPSQSPPRFSRFSRGGMYTEWRFVVETTFSTDTPTSSRGGWLGRGGPLSGAFLFL